MTKGRWCWFHLLDTKRNQGTAEWFEIIVLLYVVSQERKTLYHEHSSWQMRTSWRLGMVYTPKPHLNRPRGSGRNLRIVVGFQYWRSPEPIMYISSNPMFRDLIVSGLELAKVGVFTPQKLANTINHGFFKVSWLSPSHHWLWGSNPESFGVDDFRGDQSSEEQSMSSFWSCWR